MNIVKGRFGEEREKTTGEEKALREVSMEDKVVDFAKAKEELEYENQTGTAFDDFLSTLTPEQLVALGQVTVSIADKVFDVFADADEFMDGLDEEIDKLMDDWEED